MGIQAFASCPMLKATMYHLLIFVLLLLTWVIFSGQFDAFHLTLGALSAWFVTKISGDLLFTDRKGSIFGRLREGILLPGYIWYLVYEVVVANLHVLYLALHPNGMRELRPRMIKFRTILKTDFAKWVLANSITLTPGTVTAKIEGDIFHVHAISEAVAAGIGGEMERRVAEIFEPEVLKP